MRRSKDNNMVKKAFSFVGITAIFMVMWIALDLLGGAFHTGITALFSNAAFVENRVYISVKEILSLHTVLRAIVTTCFYQKFVGKAIRRPSMRNVITRIGFFAFVLESIKLTVYMPEFLIEAVLRLNYDTVANLVYFGFDELIDYRSLFGQVFFLVNLWFCFRKVLLKSVSEDEELTPNERKYREHVKNREEKRRSQEGRQPASECKPLSDQSTPAKPRGNIIFFDIEKNPRAQKM